MGAGLTGFLGHWTLLSSCDAPTLPHLHQQPIQQRVAYGHERFLGGADCSPLMGDEINKGIMRLWQTSWRYPGYAILKLHPEIPLGAAGPLPPTVLVLYRTKGISFMKQLLDLTCVFWTLGVAGAYTDILVS